MRGSPDFGAKSADSDHEVFAYIESAAVGGGREFREWHGSGGLSG
jgi:hypothetical protein